MMLLETVNEKQEYGRTLEDLRNVVVQTKYKFTLLLSADDLVKYSYKIMKNKHHTARVIHRAESIYFLIVQILNFAPSSTERHRARASSQKRPS
jgi:hypothetical protein